MVQLIQPRLDGGAWLDGKGRTHAQIADALGQVHCRLVIGDGLHVEDNRMRARLGIGLNPLFGFLNHEVDI